MLVTSSWYLVSRIAMACVLRMCPFLACGVDAANSARGGILRHLVNIWCLPT